MWSMTGSGSPIEPRTLMRSDTEVVLGRTSPGIPLAEQQQEDGQRHRSDSTLDPNFSTGVNDDLGKAMSGAEPEEAKPKAFRVRSQSRLPGVTRTAWLLEVGFRAALHSESQPRDMRWWWGLWRTPKNG